MTKKPKSPKASIEEIELNSAESSRLLGITQQYFNQVVRGGWIKAKGRNRYRLVDVVQGYKAYLLDEGRRMSKSAEASRVQTARADQIELQTAKELGELITVEDMLAFLSDTLGALRAEFSGFPAACSRDPAIRAAIEKQLDACIAKCRDAFAGAGDRIAARRPLVLEPEEADA